jgi:hypothetical protein
MLCVSTPSDQSLIQTSYEIYANHRSTLPVGIISYHIIMQPSPLKMPNRNFMHPERLPGAKLNAPDMSLEPYMQMQPILRMLPLVMKYATAFFFLSL